MLTMLSKHILCRFLLISLFLLGANGLSLAQTFQTRATHAYLVDWGSGSVLLAKNEDEPIPPASMAKLMTLEVVFHALATGGLSLDDEFLISENAWKKGGANSGGSTMFAKLGSSVPLDVLLKGIIVQSGNDACIAIAEGMSGNEEAFAKVMNERAKKIGLTASSFRNSTGLPAEGQLMTARDLSILARHLIDEYPEFYHLFSLPEFTWNKITQQNRNPLLGSTKGADGLKTGYTKAAGYGVVASAMDGDQRLIAVLTGMKSKRERREEARKLMSWGFRAFMSKRIYEVDEKIAFAKVHGGDHSEVMLVSERPLNLFIPRAVKGRLKGRIVYQSPLKAPLQEGEEVAVLKVWAGDKLVMEAPLVTGHSVKQGSMPRRAFDGLQELLLGWL